MTEMESTSGSIKINSKLGKDDYGNIPLSIKQKYIENTDTEIDHFTPLISNDSGQLYTQPIAKKYTQTYNESRTFAYDSSNNDEFGTNIDIMKDYLVVGAPGVDTDGCVYIYKKKGDNFIFLQKIRASTSGGEDNHFRFGQDTNGIGHCVKFDEYLNLYISAYKYNIHQ